jgi:hypothetical protein
MNNPFNNNIIIWKDDENYSPTNTTPIAVRQWKSAHQPTIPVNFNMENSTVPRFIFYSLDASYFSGKLESYLRFRKYSFQRILVTVEIFATVLMPNTGMMEVPMLYDNEKKRWLRDTTSIIETLEREDFIDSPHQVIPTCPIQRFVSFVLEDLCDEHLWAVAMWYRWAFDLDKSNLSLDFHIRGILSQGIHFVPQFLTRRLIEARQYKEYCEDFGIRDERHYKLMEHIYLGLLDACEKHFTSTGMSFLLTDDAPTLLDFGLMASCFRHFSMDPTPAKIMRDRAPSVYEWVARMWNFGSGKNQPRPSNMMMNPNTTGIPKTWKWFIDEFRNHYAEYLCKNAIAVSKNYSTFSFGNGLFMNSYTSEFRAWSVYKLAERYRTLTPEEAIQVNEIFEFDLNHYFANLPPVSNFPSSFRDEEFPQLNQLPLCQPPRDESQRNPTYLMREWNKVMGTPKHSATLKEPFYKTVLGQYFMKAGMVIGGGISLVVLAGGGGGGGSRWLGGNKL